MTKTPTSEARRVIVAYTSLIHKLKCGIPERNNARYLNSLKVEHGLHFESLFAGLKADIDNPDYTYPIGKQQFRDFKRVVIALGRLLNFYRGNGAVPEGAVKTLEEMEETYGPLYDKLFEVIR